VGKSAFDPGDPAQRERVAAEHSRVGAEMLQKLARVDVAPMLVAYEHHMYADGSGAPPRPQGYVAHPYSRMVAIADRYENLVHPSAGDSALTPDRALVQVLREAGSKLDPFLARLFANAMGPFPVGCVVRLSDQSVAVVSRQGADPLSPTVRAVFDARGLEVTDPEAEDIDLSGASLRIVEVVSAGTLDIDVAERLF
jgi:HD-GYP domain-containing protein (c-di-GMP phosphodiesterase class II)